MKPNPYFSGSYPPGDVRFLLKPIRVESTPVAVKEALIQSGQKHYSELLTHERPPSQPYVDLFLTALKDNQALMAKHVLILAHKIRERRPSGITLISLARAGTPIGVLLKRIFAQIFGLAVEHYSISIIRDIGIDENALHHILQHHSSESLVFVDGWTGKGVIAGQLAKSLHDFGEKHGISIPPELYVLSDLSGAAFVSSSQEDYLIPSSILNATVSGLVSRSVIDKNQLSATDFHGCHFYQDYLDCDLSNAFIDAVLANIHEQSASAVDNRDDGEEKWLLQEKSRTFLAWVAEMYGAKNSNLIKPGIGEATRVLLRREANLLLIQDMQHESVKHLLYLATEKNIEIKHHPQLPYRATALIKEIS
ncbi:MAG: cysteine protease StiP family protein [Methylomonas sp.]|nr:cysteine protease StiP family protein [Methylomonas sp.]PPD22063.1 MAG: hypothetical protein CTY23_03120 [Methylomonas sp.]PPD42449.1 MAG: hypothetical protein CTY17_01550 [Methylomonas sp.]PPD53867.1 MAG: hypothetical protein CTY11_05090 [Methylomonas sp.]